MSRIYIGPYVVISSRGSYTERFKTCPTKGCSNYQDRKVRGEFCYKCGVGLTEMDITTECGFRFIQFLIDHFDDENKFTEAGQFSDETIVIANGKGQEGSELDTGVYHYDVVEPSKRFETVFVENDDWRSLVDKLAEHNVEFKTHWGIVEVC